MIVACHSYRVVDNAQQVSVVKENEMESRDVDWDWGKFKSSDICDSVIVFKKIDTLKFERLDKGNVCTDGIVSVLIENADFETCTENYFYENFSLLLSNVNDDKARFVSGQSSYGSYDSDPIYGVCGDPFNEKNWWVRKKNKLWISFALEHVTRVNEVERSDYSLKILLSGGSVYESSKI